MTIRVGSFTEIEGIEDQGHSFEGPAVVLGCEGALADCASLEVLDLGSSPYESATFNQQCTERIFFGVPSTIRSSALDTNDILPSIPCIGSTESMNVMRLGSYRFPNYA